MLLCLAFHVTCNMSDILLKLILLLTPKKGNDGRIWNMFREISKDKDVTKRSNYALIIVSLILIFEHVFIPLGIIWLIKMLLMLILNKFTPHG